MLLPAGAACLAVSADRLSFTAWVPWEPGSAVALCVAGPGFRASPAVAAISKTINHIIQECLPLVVVVLLLLLI